MVSNHFWVLLRNFLKLWRTANHNIILFKWDELKIMFAFPAIKRCHHFFFCCCQKACLGASSRVNDIVCTAASSVCDIVVLVSLIFRHFVDTIFFFYLVKYFVKTMDIYLIKKLRYNYQVDHSNLVTLLRFSKVVYEDYFDYSPQWTASGDGPDHFLVLTSARVRSEET